MKLCAEDEGVVSVFVAGVVGVDRDDIFVGFIGDFGQEFFLRQPLPGFADLPVRSLFSGVVGADGDADYGEGFEMVDDFCGHGVITKYGDCDQKNNGEFAG